MAGARRFEDAIAEYNKAWALIPEPKNNWHAATWVLAAIADSAYLGGYAPTAREAIEYGMTCPGAVGNPFMHLRFGQILLDANEKDCAANELMRAYMGAGPEIFATDDSKYISSLKTSAILRQGPLWVEADATIGPLSAYCVKKVGRKHFWSV